MDILFNIIFLLVGFVMLIKGADFFVEGSSAIAKKFKIPSIIVGLTIVAMGTSFPELAVSTTAALNGSNEIAISNVIGSNLFNLIIVLGVCAIISTVKVEKNVLRKDFPFMLIITGLLVILFGDFLFPFMGIEYTKEIAGTISRFDGFILVGLFIGYICFNVKSALKHMKENKDTEVSEKLPSTILCLIYIIGGIVAIKFGGDFVVDNASDIALVLGMSETLVGLTIVSIGTSLPELVTSIVAAKKGETALAVGNVVGSNIFNILLILGVSSVICPIAVAAVSFVDICIVALVSIFTFLVAYSKNEINRKEGFMMVTIYIIYMLYAIFR